jgi:hypothetical protein
VQKKFPGVYRLFVMCSRVLLLLAQALIFQFTNAAYAASVSLAWDPHLDSNVAGYNIYRSSELGKFTSAPLNGESPVTTTSFTDSTVQAGTYYYVVRAVDISGRESDASNLVEATINASNGDAILFTIQSTTIAKPSGNSLEILDSTGAPWSAVDESKPRFGYARMQVEPGRVSNSIAVISRSVGQTVVSETSLAASVPIRAGRLYVNLDGSVNTGLAFVNNESVAAVISFYFTDAKGVDFGHGSFTLEGKHSISPFVNQAPFNLRTSMQGTLTFNSSLPVTVTGIRGLTNERGELLMTTQPVSSLDAPTARTSIIFPMFSDGGGWSTQVVLVNPTDTPVTGAVQFFGPASPGAPVSTLTITVNGVTGSLFDYIIPPRGTVRFVTANGSSDIQIGYILATPKDADVVPQGFSILSLSNQGITVSETSVRAASPETAFQMYVEKSATLHSRLAVANPSASPAWATFELAPLDGSSLSRITSIVIPAGGHIAPLIEDLFPTVRDGFQGLLRILSTQSSGVTALRIRNNKGGDVIVTGIPVASEASSSTSSTLVFPLVVRGGGFSTEFVGN